MIQLHALNLRLPEKVRLLQEKKKRKEGKEKGKKNVTPKENLPHRFCPQCCL
jgi:hypothetical protein